MSSSKLLLSSFPSVQFVPTPFWTLFNKCMYDPGEAAPGFSSNPYSSSTFDSSFKGVQGWRCKRFSEQLSYGVDGSSSKLDHGCLDFEFHRSENGEDEVQGRKCWKMGSSLPLNRWVELNNFKFWWTTMQNLKLTNSGSVNWICVGSMGQIRFRASIGPVQLDFFIFRAVLDILSPILHSKILILDIQIDSNSISIPSQAFI